MRSPRAGRLADYFDGVSPCTVEITRAVERLVDLGALLPIRPDRRSDGRHSRQLEYFDAFDDDAEAAQRRLTSARVMILGLGGTGSEFLRHMVAAGVERFDLVDKDVVELSNFNRQSLWTRGDVGLPKVEAARLFVEARCAQPRVRSLRERVAADGRLLRLMDETRPDFVFVAVDEPVETIAVDITAMLTTRGVAFLSAGVGIRFGRVDAVSTPADARVAVRTTRASLGTTNALVAASAAHGAIGHLTGIDLPFEVLHG